MPKSPSVPLATSDHVAIGLGYAKDVVSGRIDACSWVKKSCQRHLDDLDRQSTPTFPYRFDAALGSRVTRFIELLPHGGHDKSSSQASEISEHKGNYIGRRVQ